MAGGDEFPELEPTRRGPRVAITGGRVGYLTPEALLVWSLSDGKQVAKVVLEEPRAVAVLKDGALLTIDRRGRRVCRLAPGSEEAECWPSVIPMPPQGIARVFGDVKEADRFWVVGERALLGWDTKLLAGNLASAGRHDLTDVAAPGGQPVVAVLADGAFAAMRTIGFEVIAPDDGRRKLAWAAAPRELVAGPAAGQAWVTSADGSISLLQLDDPPTVVATVQRDPKDTVVYALGSSTTHVAALVAEQRAPRDGKPRWSLVAWDNSGKAALRVVLPWQPQVTEVGNDTALSVALSAKPALVAVADHSRVMVWDLATAKVVFEHTRP